jgi:hypothetical protein
VQFVVKKGSLLKKINLENLKIDFQIFKVDFLNEL